MKMPFHSTAGTFQNNKIIVPLKRATAIQPELTALTCEILLFPLEHTKFICNILYVYKAQSISSLK